MERELFNKLPYEKQVKFENMALRNVMLEFYMKEWESDMRAYFTLRPIYINPCGDEIRYYTDSYSVVQTCGKHLFASLTFSGSFSKHGFYSSNIFYDDFYFSVDQERARQMYNTLKWIENKIKKTEMEIFEDGYHKSFAEYTTAVMFALNAASGVIRDNDTNTRSQPLMILDFVAALKDIEDGLTIKYSKEQETENA